MAAEANMNEERLYPLRRVPMEVKPDGEGKGLFYFHEPGDYLSGILFGIQNRETIHYTMVTYRMRLFEGRQDGVDLIVKDDQLVEFPANVKMRRIIEDHEAIGSRVRIIFKGRRGRYKEYEVWQDKGTFFKDEEQLHGRIKRKRRKRKPK